MKQQTHTSFFKMTTIPAGTWYDRNGEITGSSLSESIRKSAGIFAGVSNVRFVSAKTSFCFDNCLSGLLFRFLNCKNVCCCCVRSSCGGVTGVAGMGGALHSLRGGVLRGSDHGSCWGDVALGIVTR